MSIIITHQKQRLQELKNSLAYTQNALTHNLEKWERKEFLKVEADFIEEIAQLESCIELAIAA